MPGRRVVRRVVGALLVVALVACTDSGKPGASSSQSSSAAPVHGGTLRIGIAAPATFDPALASPGSQSEQVVADLLFDGLTRVDPGQDTAGPALATSWDPSTDLTTWRFHLRPDARFSDGQPITATAVKASLDRVAALGDASIAGQRLKIVQSTTAVDTATVELHLASPLALLPELLAAPQYGIVPANDVDASGTFSKAPVGSGPFVFASRSDTVVRLTRARGSQALLDAIELDTYDPATAFAKGVPYDDFLAGQLDATFVPGSRAADAARASGTSRFRPFQAELFYAFNLLSPTFADARFRQAIVEAIDRDTIAQDLGAAVVQPLAGVVPDGVAGHAADPCGPTCDYSPDQARGLVGQVFPDGNVPTVQVDYAEPAAGDTGPSVDDVTASAIVADLNAVGIPAQKRSHPATEYDAFTVSGNAELFRLGAVGSYASPDAYLFPLFSSTSADNATGFHDPSVDQALAQARATADASTRLASYQNIEQQVLQQTPLVPVAQLLTRVVAAPRVHDLVFAVDGTFDAEQVWVTP